MTVRIYKLTREFEWVTWLCDACLARWLEAGWQIRGKKTVGHELTCDDREKGACA